LFPKHIVAVDGIAENENNEILLVKQRNGQYWTLPGGQVENGENLENALIREFKEESGIDISVGKLICISSNVGTHEGHNGYETVPTKVIFSFICEFKGGELRTSDETIETRWVPKDKIFDYISLPAFRKRFEAYLNFNGKDIQYLEYITKPEYQLKSERYF